MTGMIEAFMWGFHQNQGCSLKSEYRESRFCFLKKHRPILGCVPSARTWGTPDSVQKTISLDAIYSTFLKAMSTFLWQI